LTGPSNPGGDQPSEATPPASDAPIAEQPPAAASTDVPPPPLPAPPQPLGLTTFTIEGRRAPALFVVGWLAIIAAAALASLALFATAGTGGSFFWFLTFFAASVGLILLGGSQALERAAVAASYAGPSPILVLLAAISVTQVAGFAIGFPLQAVGASIPRPIGDLIAVSVQALVFFFVVRVMVVGAAAMTWYDMGLDADRRSALRSLRTGALFAGPVIFVTTLFALAAVALVGVVPASPLPPTGTGVGLIAHLLAGAVIAPVAEELLFRGFALTAWRRTLGARAAIVRSSIVFVLAHVLLVGGDTFGEALRLAFVAGVVRIPVAFALGWIYNRTGSLWSSIGLHGSFNAILIILAEMGAAAA
jgi:membrane protease YdiL (CAAX protease family)